MSDPYWILGYRNPVGGIETARGREKAEGIGRKERKSWWWKPGVNERNSWSFDFPEGGEIAKIKPVIRYYGEISE